MINDCLCVCRDVIDQTKAAQNGVLYFWLQRMEGLFLDDEGEGYCGKNVYFLLDNFLATMWGGKTLAVFQ